MGARKVEARRQRRSVSEIEGMAGTRALKDAALAEKRKRLRAALLERETTGAPTLGAIASRFNLRSDAVRAALQELRAEREPKP
jgi:hypothetical protein